MSVHEMGFDSVWVHSGYFDIIQQHRALGRGHHGGGGRPSHPAIYALFNTSLAFAMVSRPRPAVVPKHVVLVLQRVLPNQEVAMPDQHRSKAVHVRWARRLGGRLEPAAPADGHGAALRLHGAHAVHQVPAGLARSGPRRKAWFPENPAEHVYVPELMRRRRALNYMHAA